MMPITLNLGLQLLLHHNLSLVYLHSEENEYTMCMLYPIPLYDILLCTHVGTYGQYCMHRLSYVLYGKRFMTH